MQALALDTWHGGCQQNVRGRAAGAGAARGGGTPVARGGRAGEGGGVPYPPENCPAVLGPDWDFSSSSSLATTADGRDIIIAPQKQGLVWGLGPGKGQAPWRQDVGREIAGGAGETPFGQPVGNERANFGPIN